MAKSKNPTIEIQLAPPATEEPAQPSPPANYTQSPVEQVTIPVRPAVVTIMNLAATATTLAATSGPAAIAVLAGAGITGAAMARHHHNQRDKQEQRNRMRQLRRMRKMAGGPGLGLGGFGKGGSKPSRTAGIGSGTGHHGAGKKSPIGSPLGALARALKGSSHRPGRRHGGHVGGSRTPLGRLGRIGRLGRRLANTPLGRATRKAAPAVRAAGRVARVAGVGTLGFLGGLGWLITRTYRFLCWLTWKIRNLLKIDEVPTKEIKADDVLDTVNDPTRTTDQDEPSIPKRSERTAMAGDQTQGTNPASHQGTSPMWEIMKNACDQIAGIQHKGNMTTRSEAYDLAAIVAMVGQTVGMRAASYRNESLDSTFIDLYVKAEEALYAVAQQLLPLGEFFDALHPERVRDLLGGNNPSGWDTTTNQTIG
jgi:hypothetical protein